MQIISKSVSELHPAPYNPRVELKPSDPRYRKLKRSIQTFGLVEPLLWNEATGYLVGGHQRLRVLKDLQVERIDVSVVHLCPEQEKALNIVLNNREAQSDWDIPLLTHALEELAALPEPQLLASGFDTSHLKTLQTDLEPVEATWQEDDNSAGYEITLQVPFAQLNAVRSELDGLIEKYHLVTHMRQR